MMSRIVLFGVAWLGLSGWAVASPPVKLALADCGAVSGGVSAKAEVWFGAHAGAYRPYLTECRVRDGRGRVVLKIVALRQDAAARHHRLYFYHGKPWDGQDSTALMNADPVPLPVILTPGDRAVGHLQEGLFGEGPGTKSVSFEDWRGDWPRRIVMRVAGAAVLGTYCTPPLIWNAGQDEFVQSKGPAYTGCK